MLSVSSVSKSYGARILFENVSFAINKGDRVALVGANGVGKTTLLNIILGLTEADSGKISLNKGVKIGFLPQETIDILDERSVFEVSIGITPEHSILRQRLTDFENKGQKQTDAYAAASARYNELNGYELERKAEKILLGLAFKKRDFSRSVKEMSGGWVMRAHIARLLVMEPDLLILDEPTNHLDLETLLWFQDYLKSYPGAIFMISHDRAFLNELITKIIEIKDSTLRKYNGNYDDYCLQRQAREEQLLAAYKNQQQQIASLQRFVDRFGAKATKASQAQSKLKQIQRMELIQAPEVHESKMNIVFPQPERSGQEVLSLHNLHHAYGEIQVYRGIDLEIQRGEKIVFIGPNGAGKSTLLKILAGVLPIQHGERKLGLKVKVGYYSQNRIDMLNLENTVLEEAMSIPNPPLELTVRTILGSFLFHGDDVFKKVSMLSGGEKSRLSLVKILLNPPNLLLMDEPTIHLDIASCDVLIDALKQYQGTLLFISHDVNFIRSLADKVLRIEAGLLKPYAGGYDYYLHKIQSLIGTKENIDPVGGLFNAQPVEENKDDEEKSHLRQLKKIEKQKRIAYANRKRELTMSVKKLEKQISEAENRQRELITQLENPSLYKDNSAVQALNKEIQELGVSLEKLNQQWEQNFEELSIME